VALPCSPGYYCLINAACGNGATDAGTCVVAPNPTPTGFYTTAGAYSITECTCAPGFYCPESSVTPAGVACIAGHYCIGGADTWVATSLCSEGYYCAGGAVCANGATDPGTCVVAATPCSAGHYCRPGATSNTGAGSGGGTCTCMAGMYCPAGAASPNLNCISCPAGSYCTGADPLCRRVLLRPWRAVPKRRHKRRRVRRVPGPVRGGALLPGRVHERDRATVYLCRGVLL
jgi:hypothetical protein